MIVADHELSCHVILSECIIITNRYLIHVQYRYLAGRDYLQVESHKNCFDESLGATVLSVFVERVCC